MCNAAVLACYSDWSWALCASKNVTLWLMTFWVITLHLNTDKNHDTGVVFSVDKLVICHWSQNEREQGAFSSDTAHVKILHIGTFGFSQSVWVEHWMSYLCRNILFPPMTINVSSISWFYIQTTRDSCKTCWLCRCCSIWNFIYQDCVMLELLLQSPTYKTCHNI